MIGIGLLKTDFTRSIF